MFSILIRGYNLITLFCFFISEKVLSQNINVEPEFLIGQSSIEREEGPKFSGNIFEAGINFDFYTNKKSPFIPI